MSDVSLRMTLQDEVSSKIDQMTSKVRTASSQFKTFGRDIDNTFRARGAESFASSLGSSMDSAASSASALGDALDDALNSMDSSAAAALGDSLESAQTSALGLADTAVSAGDGIADLGSESASLNELGRGADDASRSMESLGNSVDDAGEALDDVDAGGLGDVTDEAQNAGEAMDDASGRAENFGRTMKRVIAALGLAKLAGEIKDFTASTIELGTGFTAQMSEVGAISGATGRELEMLESTAREYGSSTIFSASQAGEALKYMSLAGWDANQSASALGGVLNLAAASGMQLGEASDMVTDYLTAFGMEASQSSYFADMLAYAQSNSNTTARQLGEAYLNSAANLHAAGQDVETTTALLEAMANQGTKGARAGTQLAAMARDITNAMDDGKIMIGDTSIAVQDAEGNFRDFTDILGDVETAVDGMGSAERAAALSEVFTSYSIRGINQVLTEGVDKVAAYEEALRGSAGAAEEAADVMNDNLKGDLANFNSATEEMKLKIFDNLEQPLRDFVQYGTNEMIPALSEWLPDAFGSAAKGIGNVAQALKPLFEMVIKNPEAIGGTLTSVGAGMTTLAVGMKVADVSKRVTELGGMGSALAKLAGPLMAHPWAAGAAAVVAGVTAIGMAVKAYNDIQVEKSLADRFGDVALTSSQIDEMATKILNARWTVNAEASLGHFSKAEDFARQAQEALAANDVIEWKARVGIKLSDDDKASYMQNIQSYISSMQQELQQQTLAVELALSFTEIKLSDGGTLSDKLQSWAKADMLEMDRLSSQLTDTVQKALEDGIINVDEQAAIDALQEKMNNIMAGWKEAEAQAEMDLLEMEYGRMSGKALTADSFSQLVERLGEQRQTAAAALEESTKSALAAIEGARRNGRLTESDYDMVMSHVSEARRNEEAGMLVRSLNFESNTLSDTYGEKIKANTEQNTSRIEQALANANRSLVSPDQYGSLMETLLNGVNSAMTPSGMFSGADQQALNKIWDVMKPDAAAMTSLMDEYRELGQAVPQTVMDEFNRAMEIGAAAGDRDAAWQVFANQLVGDDANQALEEAILNGTAQVPKQLKDAVERASLEVTEDPPEIDGITAEVENMEVNASDATVDTGNVESAVAEAHDEAEQVAEAAASDPLETEMTLTTSNVDASGLTEGINNALAGQEAGSITVPVNVSLGAGNVDSTALLASVQTDLTSKFSTAFPAAGNVDVTLTKASDNIDAVYNQVGSEIDSKFSHDYSTSANLHVSIHVDYSIANPTKTVTFGGAGSGSGTITAHALGGYFDEPHLGVVAEDGGEYIIPMNGSPRSLEMWHEAGEMLGVFQKTQGASVGASGSGGREIPAFAPNAAPAVSQTPSGGSDRTININIGGNGSIRVSGGGVNKETIVGMMLENMKDVLLQIVEQEIVEEGDAVYAY